MRVSRFVNGNEVLELAEVAATTHIAFDAADEPQAVVYGGGVVEVHPAGRDEGRTVDVVLTWPSVLDLQRWVDALVADLGEVGQ